MTVEHIPVEEVNTNSFQKFEAGDVVVDSRRGQGIIIQESELLNTTKQTTLGKMANTEHYKNNNWYAVKWFTGKPTMSPENLLTHCKGMEDSNICNECEHISVCWTSIR